MMHTIQRTLWALVAALLLLGCGTKGSGKATTETRAVGPFTAVEVRGVIELELAIGSAPGAGSTAPATGSVELSGDDNLVPLVIAEVSGDRLILKTEEGIRPDLPLVARVTAPGPITEIVGRGATEIRAHDLVGPSLRVEISGAGEADLAGEVEALELRVSGAGSMDAQRLAAKRVDARISGAGGIEVGEPEELVADISGAGSIEYAGDPKLTKSISGAGSIKKR